MNGLRPVQLRDLAFRASISRVSVTRITALTITKILTFPGPQKHTLGKLMVGKFLYLYTCGDVYIYIYICIYAHVPEEVRGLATQHCCNGENLHQIAYILPFDCNITVILSVARFPTCRTLDDKP